MNRTERSLPWAPRPFQDEALGSWFGRLAAAYGLDVDDFAAYAGLSIDFTSAGGNWLALPRLSSGDSERLRTLCRLPTKGLPVAYETDAPARLGYCHHCLYLNPLDVTAPYWPAHWLLGMDGPRCSQHDQPYERTSPSVVRRHRNMRRLLGIVSRVRATRLKTLERQKWTLARFVIR